MATPRPPLIFVDRGGEVSVFDSVRDAEASLEAIDVSYGEYRGFDGDGRPLRLSYEGMTKLRSGSVGVTGEAELRSDEARALIVETAVRQGADQSMLEAMSLPDLIDFLRP